MKQNEDAVPSIPDDVWRDALRYRFVRVADKVPISHEAARDPAAYDEAIDRAMRERGCGSLPAPKGISRGPTQAVLDVLAERRRQIETEGWTPLHDDAHDVGDLSSAAMGYAQSAACQLSHDGLEQTKCTVAEASPRVLDPCSGSRMMWFDRGNQDVVFGDRRREALTVTDRSHGREGGTRTLTVAPDMLMDFRDLPFEDGTFRLVAFDPPHLVRAGPRSWLAAKYGKLGKDWRDDLRQGFAECFRVLHPHGVLVFKWSETQVKLREVIALTPHRPLFGNTSGKKAGTHWLVFMKPSSEAPAEEAQT